MVFKSFSDIKNFQEGITLVEVVVVIFMVVLFSALLISNFPKILREFALSRATYKLAQDIRKTQDLGLSGVQITDDEGQSISAKGYGIYVDLRVNPTEEYLIYADRGELNYKYDDGDPQLCSENEDLNLDCALEIIDVTKGNPDLFIKGIENISGNFVSVNFSPPNPIINIDNLQPGSFEIGIVLGLRSDDSAQRTVWVNTSGLIRIK